MAIRFKDPFMRLRLFGAAFVYYWTTLNKYNEVQKWGFTNISIIFGCFSLAYGHVELYLRTTQILLYNFREYRVEETSGQSGQVDVLRNLLTRWELRGSHALSVQLRQNSAACWGEHRADPALCWNNCFSALQLNDADSSSWTSRLRSRNNDMSL